MLVEINEDKVYQSESTIISNAHLNEVDITFKAAQEIILEKDFTVEPNANFNAEIDECD